MDMRGISYFLMDQIMIMDQKIYIKLDINGVDDSMGIWAPCLSFDNGTYYLTYTVVKSVRGGYMDAQNFLVTSNKIDGDWSEPVFLNRIGFDPSLFHDNDGRKWFVGLTRENSPGHSKFGGIVLQEYSIEEKKLVGSMIKIFDGTPLGYTEGPHIYKKDGYYYLLTAEGGTGYGHAVTMARAESIKGPYILDPGNPMLTSRNDRSLPIQKAGHADIVEMQNGEWYLVHLCGRPLPGSDHCILGRETCLQKVYWNEDGWLRIQPDGNKPKEIVADSGLMECKWPVPEHMDHFDSNELRIEYQSLRIPLTKSVASLTERPGYLRLKGKESLSSPYQQSLIARRQQAFCYTADTCVEFNPESHKHLAGLVCYYSTRNYHYLYVSRNKIGKCLGIITCNNGKSSFSPKEEISIDGIDRVYLRVEVDFSSLKFYYSTDGDTWKHVGDELDASILSDENCKSSYGFTGAFVGLCCQDMLYGEKYADFDYFMYLER
jgi:xylan 1,4-beta-xylosidase